jgi:hypothetical protein
VEVPADGVLVSSPQVLGDTYEELTANFEKLAAADLALLIVPRKDRERGFSGLPTKSGSRWWESHGTGGRREAEFYRY